MMTEPATPREHALVLFRQAHDLQIKGELDRALELYSRSIDVCPTAEAFTFRGWAYAFRGDYTRAIRECMQAIEIDPDYGNAYNDIGAYLIALGNPDEAIPWLESALRARRYTSPAFAHFNLGRAHEARRNYARALECYRASLAVDGDYKVAREAITRLHARWN